MFSCCNRAPNVWEKSCQLRLSSALLYVQSTLAISNSTGLSEIVRDIRTSTYQICRNEEKLIRLTTFNKYMCNWTLEVRDILKILWKRGEIALFHNIFYMLLDFHVKAGTRFSLRDKRLFEISEVEITRVNCICLSLWCGGLMRIVIVLLFTFYIYKVLGGGCVSATKVMQMTKYFVYRQINYSVYQDISAQISQLK